MDLEERLSIFHAGFEEGFGGDLGMGVDGFESRDADWNRLHGVDNSHSYEDRRYEVSSGAGEGVRYELLKQGSCHLLKRECSA